MIELVTFLAFFNGIETIVTLVKFTAKWSHMYTETLHKLERNAIVLIAGEGGLRLKKKSANTSMGKFGRALYEFVSRIELASIERDEDRHQRRMAKLEAARVAKAKREEQAKETEMFAIGILKDALSQHYVMPDNMLQMICRGIQAKQMDETRRAELLDLVTDLTMMDVSKFKPFERELLWVDVVLPLTGRTFECMKLDEPVYHPATIIMLKQAIQRLVYHNVAAIRHENPMAI